MIKKILFLGISLFLFLSAFPGSIPELIKQSGCSEDYPNQNLLIMRQIVLIITMTGEQSTERLTLAWRQWPKVSAVKHQRLHKVEADLFNRPTARMIEGLELLASIIHPDLPGVASGR